MSTNIESYLKKLSEVKAPKPISIGSQIGQIRDAMGAHGMALTDMQMDQTDLAATRLGQIYGREQGRATVAERKRIENLFPAYRQTMLDASPELRRLVEMGDNLGPSAIESQLTRMAQDDLALGRSLSPEQERAAIQAARSGASARGMAVGMPTLAAEVLNRDAAASAREASRRQFAAGIDQMNQGRINSDRGFAGQLAAGMDPQARMQAVAAPDIGMASQQTSTGNIWNAGMQTSAQNQALAQNHYNQATNILGSYYDAQMNQQFAQQNNRANAKAGNTQAAVSAGASIAAAAMIAFAICWVARSVYGWQDPRWVLFRRWLLTRAPEWLRVLYARRGAQFARWLHTRPWARAALRPLFNLAIRFA